MTTPARKPVAQVAAYIGREIDWQDSGFGSPWTFGSLPGGASPSMVTLQFTDGFNFSKNSNFVITIGTKADPARFLNVTLNGPNPTRIDQPVDQTKTRPMVDDAECFISITPTDPSAKVVKGHIVAYMTFVPHPLMRDAASPW